VYYSFVICNNYCILSSLKTVRPADGLISCSVARTPKWVWEPWSSWNFLKFERHPWASKKARTVDKAPCNDENYAETSESCTRCLQLMAEMWVHRSHISWWREPWLVTLVHCALDCNAVSTCTHSFVVVAGGRNLSSGGVSVQRNSLSSSVEMRWMPTDLQRWRAAGTDPIAGSTSLQPHLNARPPPRIIVVTR